MAKLRAIKLIYCYRCGHEWVPHSRDVNTCPRCKSRYWNVPKSETSVSKSFINVCSALTFARYCVETTKQDFTDQKLDVKINRIADRLENAVQNARNLWPKATKAEADIVAARIHQIADTAICGNKKRIEITSLGLRLLNDILPHLKKHKAKAIETIIDELTKLHNHFEEDGGTDDEAYEAADRTAEQWYEMIGIDK
jgi:DNA-directed RNA polymerase subunit RPC12/RpoP